MSSTVEAGIGPSAALLFPTEPDLTLFVSVPRRFARSSFLAGRGLAESERVRAALVKGGAATAFGALAILVWRE